MLFSAWETEGTGWPMMSWNTPSVLQTSHFKLIKVLATAFCYIRLDGVKNTADIKRAILEVLREDLLTFLALNGHITNSCFFCF